MTLELTSSTKDPFALGEWSIAPDRNEIRRDGEVLRLEPLSMRLLCLLAENAGRTVSRAEIVHRLWGGRAVTDDAVGRQVAKLREAFRDDARRPAVIQTVPRVGVLLLPPVQPAARALPAPEPIDRPQPAPLHDQVSQPGRSWLPVGAGLSAMVALVVGGVLLSERQTGKIDAAETPVTALVGVEQDPALSPNGAMLAYVSDAEPDGFGLYSRRLAEDDAVRLTSGGYDGCKPAWTPEGDRVAFVRHMHGRDGCEIVVVSPVSLQTRVIARCQDARGGGLAWAGPAGLVFADRGGSRSRRLQLYRAPLEGGAPVALTAPPAGSSGDSRPVYAPESHAIYFLRGVSGDVSEIFRLDLTSGKVTQVTRERSALLGLSSGGPGRLLVSAQNRAGSPPALWSVNLRDGRWTQKATGGDYRNVTSSADGRQVVFERPQSRFALVSYDPQTKQETPLTRSNRREWFPVLSPRGDRLAFISSRSGGPQVWLARADGSGLEQLTFGERGRPDELAWAPDGRSLVMSWSVRGQYDLAQVDIQSGALAKLSSTARADEQNPVFGPGGRLFFTRKLDGEHYLVRRDLATGQEAVVARDVVRAVPAEDGGFYVTRPEQEGIWRLRAKAPLTRVAPFPALAPARDWTYRDGAIWSLASGALFRTDPSTGRTQDLGLPNGEGGISGLDVLGGRAIYARQDDFDIDLYRLGR